MVTNMLRDELLASITAADYPRRLQPKRLNDHVVISIQEYSTRLHLSPRRVHDFILPRWKSSGRLYRASERH